MERIHNFKNRGMNFEKMIDDTNKYYALKQRAYIYKKPTPIKILKVQNNKVEGVFKEKSTTDYNGIYNGLHVDFEAKTTNGSNFILSNIKPHQLQHLKNINSQNGVAFILVYFKEHQRVFYLPYILVQQSKVKQLSITFFELNCIEIKLQLNPVLNYLDALDEWRKRETDY